MRLSLLLLCATAPVDASITLLDFENSYVKYNNLGGMVRHTRLPQIARGRLSSDRQTAPRRSDSTGEQSRH